MLAALLVSQLAIVQLVTVAELDSPRPNGWVVDQADVLEPQDEARLGAIAQALYDARGIEMAIVTVDDVAGRPKPFATKLFSHWKIGAADTNTGILVLLVMGKRRLEVEVGTGMEAALTSAWLAHMQDREMVPRFKTGDFPGGLVAGVRAIEAQLMSVPVEARDDGAARGEYRDDGAVTPSAGGPATATGGVAGAPEPPPRYVYVPLEPERNTGGLVALGLVVVGGVVGGALVRRRLRARRTCRRCRPARQLLRLDEIADDAYLDPGRRAEERVGSADWEVLVCPGCQAARARRHRRWFSGHTECPGCHYQTLSVSTVTTVPATHDHVGQIDVTEACAHCDRVHTYARYTRTLALPVPAAAHSSTASALESWMSASPSSSTPTRFASSSTSPPLSSSSSSSPSPPSPSSPSPSPSRPLSSPSDSRSGFGGGQSSGGGAGSSW